MKITNHDSSTRSVQVGLILASALLLSTPNAVQGFSTTTITRSLDVPIIKSSISLRALPSQSDSPSNSENAMDSSTALSYSNAEYMPGMLKTTDASSVELKSARVQHQWTKQNLAIAMPALMGLLADPVLSMVDTGFVGRSGPINLAALGVCTSIFHMAFTVFRASTVATTSLVGSAETEEEKRQITKLSLQFAGVLGTVVLLALRLGGPHMLATMGVSKSSPLFKPACDYLFARCWAAPAVVGLVVAEGAFRGNDDSKTPLVASGIAAVINLILDPLLMFPLGMGMAGAAVATAVSQFGAAGLYGWRLMKRRLLPQPTDTTTINKAKVIRSILGANMAMLAKQGSMLVFYTAATALATRMGPMHVATHQVALSLFWLVTMWLDSGSISSQVLMSKNMNTPAKARSLTKYMVKYALLQGLAFSALVGGIGKFVPGVFTSDATIQSLILRCLPHLAVQQTVVSLTLILEGLAIGGNQFRYMAAGTAVSTAVGVAALCRATSVVGIWGSAVNIFFALRLVNAIIGVARVHMGLNRKERMESENNGLEPVPVS
eukprot:CAMPEP_0117035076 /NCGR_PEP_ID=MMETSP0472-20121206/24933_1 /TAXON_ID=693140 ORGANISM="Tiarina fusus, Strain LIS" /NCGR_SAMPLE_ID=MMETSP0472 /ASSEMBLY_ACC=CAM_ASM_000603 /LENGTH=549 /DNA_ID=CAMNT_0004744437 /DNA_START=150 /DNA_END=1799 /DNA_ORIENTATION=-